MAKILFLITAPDCWTLADGYRQPAGFWAEEAVGPYAVLDPCQMIPQGSASSWR